MWNNTTSVLINSCFYRKSTEIRSLFFSTWLKMYLDIFQFKKYIERGFWNLLKLRFLTGYFMNIRIGLFVNRSEMRSQLYSTSFYIVFLVYNSFPKLSLSNWCLSNFSRVVNNIIGWRLFSDKYNEQYRLTFEIFYFKKMLYSEY